MTIHEIVGTSIYFKYVKRPKTTQVKRKVIIKNLIYFFILLIYDGIESFYFYFLAIKDERWLTFFMIGYATEYFPNLNAR